MRFATRWRSGRLASAVSSLLLATALQAGAAAPAQAAALPEISTLFNSPTGTVAEQQAIRLQIQAFINQAPTGSDITVALYHLWDETTSRALATAHTERQVNVKVMLDETSVSDNPSNPSYGILEDALGTDRTGSSFVGLCPAGKSCLGDPAAGSSINHNKFFLFSQVDGASNVVLQTSSNLTPSAYNRMRNDAVILQNVGIYTGYANYFKKLVASDWDSWSYSSTTASPYKAYFYPYAGSGNSQDTIWNILDGVTCKYTDSTGTAQTTKIRVAVLKLTRQGVADKLVALKNAGCQVEVVYAETDSVASSGASGTWEALHSVSGLTPRCYNYDEDADSSTTNSVVHSKYLLIDGIYNNSNSRERIVWTGSHNYSNAALRANDEALLKIDSSAVHDEYVTNFNAVKNEAVPGTADNTAACKGA